jgi:hypothetical protein
MQESVRLILNRLDHPGVTVARVGDADAGRKIKEGITVDILEYHASGSLCYGGRGLGRGSQICIVSFDDSFAFGTR